MTEIGVRSSCDASAVNSACRRRTSSDGAEARSPTTVAPANVATAKMAPNTSSATSKVDRTFAVPAMLCPATSTVPAAGMVSNLKVELPTFSVTGAAPQSRTGRAGAEGVSAVTTPSGATDHTKSGASSTS